MLRPIPELSLEKTNETRLVEFLNNLLGYPQETGLQLTDCGSVRPPAPDVVDDAPEPRRYCSVM